MVLLVLLLVFILLLVCAVYFVFHIDKSIRSKDSKLREIEHYIHTPESLRRDSPRADLALNYMVIEFHNSRDENALLSILKLYLFGLNPRYTPNKITGLKLIQFINDNEFHFSKTFILHCKVLWEQTSSQVYNDPDVFGTLELPDNIVEKISQAVQYHRENDIPVRPCAIETAPFGSLHEAAHELEHTDREEYRDIVEDILTAEQDATPYDGENDANATRRNVRSDSQNVHNLSVPNAVHRSLNAIVSLNVSIPLRTFQDTFQSYRDDLNGSDLDEETKSRAVQVVRSFSNSPHSRFQMSEQEVFIHVYERIDNSRDKDSLVNLLTQNLASGVEYDTIVCSTGKITRMVSTFDVVDDEIPDLKPDWVLREEISAIAAKTREDVLNESSPREREDYETDSNSELSETMQNRFIEEITKRYVHEGILSEAGLTLLSSEYLDAF